MQEEISQLKPQKHKGWWDDFEKLYANKLENLEEVDTFLETTYKDRIIRKQNIKAD